MPSSTPVTSGSSRGVLRVWESGSGERKGGVEVENIEGAFICFILFFLERVGIRW